MLPTLFNSETLISDTDGSSIHSTRQVATTLPLPEMNIKAIPSVSCEVYFQGIMYYLLYCIEMFQHTISDQHVKLVLLSVTTTFDHLTYQYYQTFTQKKQIS